MEGQETFEELFRKIKEAVECTNAQVTVKKYEGTGGVQVICQEHFHHNFDMTHEHWREVAPPTSADECCNGRSARAGGTLESLAFVHILITGDRAAGKTTFLNGLTSGALQILQALRYDSSAFYNIWYAPDIADLRELKKSLTERGLPFFQTELAHGVMTMEAGELRFFMEDEELSDDPVADQPPPETVETLNNADHALVRLLEIGGDGLRELQEMKEGKAQQDRVKEALYLQVGTTLRAASRLVYFANVKEMVSSPEAAAALLGRLQYLRSVSSEDASLIIIGTKVPATPPPDSLLVDPREDPRPWERLWGTLQRSGEVESMLDDAPTSWGCSDSLVLLSRLAGFEGATAFIADHLQEDQETFDFQMVLRTLHRILRGKVECTSNETVLPILAEQTANLLLRRRVHYVDRHHFSELLEDVEKEIEGGDIYRSVVHPMVVIPPSALCGAFPKCLAFLERSGLACRTDKFGIPALDILVDGKGWSGETEEEENKEPGWRVLSLPTAVDEAKRALNLFSQSRTFNCTAQTRDAVLEEGWGVLADAKTPSQLWRAVAELFLAAAFLDHLGVEGGGDPITLTDLKRNDDQSLKSATISGPLHAAHPFAKGEERRVQVSVARRAE